MLKTWKEFTDYLFTYPAHKDIILPLDFFSKKVLQQHYSVLADGDGQIANYRLSVDGSNQNIHVKEYDDHYKVHWDHANPSIQPIRHLMKDAPHHIPTAIVGALVTLAIAYYLTKK